MAHKYPNLNSCLHCEIVICWLKQKFWRRRFPSLNMLCSRWVRQRSISKPRNTGAKIICVWVIEWRVIWWMGQACGCYTGPGSNPTAARSSALVHGKRTHRDKITLRPAGVWCVAPNLRICAHNKGLVSTPWLYRSFPICSSTYQPILINPRDAQAQE